MARGGNLRISSNLLGEMASPKFARAAGLSIGAGMLGAQRREDEAEERATEEATLELLRQAQVAQETGDTRLLNDVTTKLDGMLTGTTSTKARDLITDGLTTVGGQRAATQQAAQTNTAMSIIKTEQAIEDMNNSTAPMTNEEYMQRAKVQGALEDRLAKMKQNSAAVVEADNIKYQTKFDAIKRENELAEQQKLVAMRALSSTQFGSDAYKENASQLRKQGFGQAVDQYETTQYALVEAKEKADEIRRSKAPLTKAEEEMLRNNNFEPTGDIRRDRDRLALISEQLDRRTIAMANRKSGEVANVRNHVVATLETLKEQGDIPLNLFDDLYNKIDGLLEDSSAVDQIAGLLERPEGEQLSSVEIQNAVTQIIKSKYPDQFADMQTSQQNIQREQAEIDFLTADLLAEAGVASRNKDGSVNLEGVKPEQIEEARRVVERRRGPLGFLFSDNTDPDSVERERQARQNIAESMGRGI